MKVVTDASANLSSERAAELGVEIVPFQITFMGKTYRDGIDFFPEDLYRLYQQNPEEFVTTSQPSVGDFVNTYEKLGNEEILSVHLSSGLSGAYSSAKAASHLIFNDQVTVVDSKTVGPALGWMVEAAAFGAKHDWSRERILSAMREVGEHTLTMVSFSDIKYLAHSGRINHLQGIAASLLRIKPVIGMNPEDGRYSSVGQELTVSRAVRKMVDTVTERFGHQQLRLQLMHGNNLSGVDLLRTAITRVMNCVEEKLVSVTPVLGAHAGPTVVGLAVAPEAIFERLFKVEEPMTA